MVGLAAAAARKKLGPENLLSYLLPQRRLSWATRYAATVAIVGAFVLLQSVFLAHFTNRPFLLFTLAVFLVSLIFDRGSGYLATGLAAFSANFFFLHPIHRGLPDRTEDIVGTVTFVVIGAAIATLTEALRKTLEKVAQDERDRALLLKEINHRIRNDLQMISALLQLSSRSLDPKEALASANERVAILSEVYGILTDREDGPQLNTKELLEKLVSMFQSRILGVRPIRITAAIESLEITTRCATALALILNELVTNALKHAFPDGREGTIGIELQRAGDGLALIVSDDGAGLPPAWTRGFGSALIRQLSSQHGGEADFANRHEGGVRVTVTMPSTCLLTNAA